MCYNEWKYTVNHWHIAVLESRAVHVTKVIQVVCEMTTHGTSTLH